jgi:hypothetical protein
MARLYAVIAKTTAYESVLDSVWEERKKADDRMYEVWDYPTIFRAEVQQVQLNKIDENLVHEMSRDLYGEHYDEY